MAYPPPSYRATAYNQIWILVAPYILARDLYAACLVCQVWHQILSPYLWGSPGWRLGSDNDSIYLALTRFKRLLKRARFEIRSLVHTLHIPPAEQEFYGGPQAGWLRDILDRLPQLQALIVSNLSFFDHQSLKTIHESNDRYPLRLLIASNCENTTAGSLDAALLHFPDLIYLDLSGAHGSRNPHVLRRIAALKELRVLKLKNCGLRDDDIDYLSFGHELRSLDIRENFLTERGACTIIERLTTHQLPRYNRKDSRGCHSGAPWVSDALDDGLESSIASRLTSSVDGHLFIEGLPSAFTHLYLGSNSFTVNTLSKILKYPGLEQLDCGSLNLSQQPHDLVTTGSPSSLRRFSNPPEIDILSPDLFTHSFQNLTRLRIHHSVVTSHPFSGNEIPTSEQCFELHGEDLRYEADSTEISRAGEIFELEDTSSVISKVTEPEEPPDDVPEIHHTFESPDDVGSDLVPVSPVSPTDSTTRSFANMLNQKRPSSIKRYSKPPKSVPSHISISTHTGTSPSNVDQRIISAPAGPETVRYHYSKGEEKCWNETLNRSKSNNIKDLINEITQRRHRIEARERHPGRFKPSMLPHLKTLTLTDVPSTTRRRAVPDSLLLFIQECAEEEELAGLERLSRDQDVPPEGFTYCANLRNRDVPLRLQHLVLEMTLAPDPILPCQAVAQHPMHSPRHKRESLSFTKSSTEDADSEMFMNATESDFSFFGEDDGGLLVSEGRIDRRLAGEFGLMVDYREDGQELDVVGELSGFRREKRRRWESLDRVRDQFGNGKGSGVGVDMGLMGHWRGEVKVVKKLRQL